MFTTNTKRTISLLLTLAVLLSAMSGIGMAAKPTVETDSEISDSYTIVYNESQNQQEYLMYVADSNNSAIEITDPDGNVIYRNESAETVNATANTYRVGLDSVDDFSDLEVGGGENVTLTATITNNTEAESPDTTNLTVYYLNEDDSARLFVGDDDAAGDVVEFRELTLRQQLPYIGNDVQPANIEETFEISGQNTTNVSLSISNESTQDAFSQSLEGADTGGWTPASYATVNGHIVPVFAESSPDVSWLDTDEDAYAVASEDGSEVTVHNLDAVVADTDTEVTISMTANEKMGFLNAKSMFEDLGAGATTWAFEALKAI